MDLNAFPEDEEQPFEEPVEHTETAVETMHREREERRRRMKRENQDQGQKRSSQPEMKKTRNSERVRQLPEGWLDCPSVGMCIGQIIPSKVPLDESYNDLVVPGKRYSPKNVIFQQKKHRREIGLVIDLTNSYRYYSPSEWEKQSIKHVKIACKGRDAVPNNESVNKFVFEVMQFLFRQKHAKKCVLVHCTHGHNRTGFMIVHFLVRTRLLHVADALQQFCDVRPPGIYKADYIDALFKFYHYIPENVLYPSTPEWKRSSDLDLNGDALQDDEDDGDMAAHRQENTESGILTNDDILGDSIPFEQQDVLRQYCYQYLGLALPGRAVAQFPGSHPVSLNSDNLQLLRQRCYYATWKADGTRYMMLITTHGSYLIDRNFCFRRVQMRFPSKATNEGVHIMTLIDGEMVIDEIPGAGLKRRYLAYDLMVHNGQSVVKFPFSERWRLLEEEIIRPRNIEKKQFECDTKMIPIYKYEMEPFGVRRKDFWLLSTVVKLLRELIPKLCHAADGLIFQGWEDPYVPRTHEGLLKWKYPEMNSVDFLFEVGSENRSLLFLYERGKKKLMDGARIMFKDDEVDVSSCSGKIVECSWDPKENSWVCMRLRADKSTPNDINTYRKVMRSISDNITEADLLNEINETIGLPMYAADKKQHHHHHQQQHRRQQHHITGNSGKLQPDHISASFIEEAGV